MLNPAPGTKAVSISLVNGVWKPTSDKRVADIIKLKQVDDVINISKFLFFRHTRRLAKKS
jgi:hypothetical protein